MGETILSADVFAENARILRCRHCGGLLIQPKELTPDEQFRANTTSEPSKNDVLEQAKEIITGHKHVFAEAASVPQTTVYDPTTGKATTSDGKVFSLRKRKYKHKKNWKSKAKKTKAWKPKAKIKKPKMGRPVKKIIGLKCPECGKEECIHASATQAGTPRFKCKACGHWFTNERERLSLSLIHI